MSDSSDIFFTAIGCMDGRVQDPVARFGRSKFDAQFPDTITEAGLVGLFEGDLSEEFVSNLKKKILISVEKHHSKGIIVHGHQDCAGNPVPNEKHKEDILKASEIIRSFVPEEIPVIPVFVVKNKDWEVLELKN